jgi:hypothetical protein
MGLLDAFLKAYHEDGQSVGSDSSHSDRFVDKVEKGVSTMAKNVQPTVIKHKMSAEWSEKGTAESQDPIFSALKKPPGSKGLIGSEQNVDIVACVRESESTILNSLLNRKTSSPPSPVSSLARASNIVYKISNCDSCPACGHWDGYGRMGPGRYCFFSAYFKAKTAKPVPIAEAQKACPKMWFAEIGWPSKTQGYK